MHRFLAGSLVILLICVFSCSRGDDGGEEERDVTVFLAACFAPFMDAVEREAGERLGIRMRQEISGSQVAIRKVTELGRECDLLMVADHRLFKEMASSHVSWRLDFAHDEVVLGVGVRAKRVDEAEEDWVPVLLDENIDLGRVDETLGPIGYRTLLVWMLKEAEGQPGLTERLKTKSEKVVEHVMHLATLLKAGDLDYGFLYRSTCIRHDIRFIPLDKTINLGHSDVDYSRAVYRGAGGKPGSDAGAPVTPVVGAPITYSLTIPSNAGAREEAIELIRFMLQKGDGAPDPYGFRFFPPEFHGPARDFAPFKNFATRIGAF